MSKRQKLDNGQVSKKKRNKQSQACPVQPFSERVNTSPFGRILYNTLENFPPELILIILDYIQTPFQQKHLYHLQKYALSLMIRPCMQPDDPHHSILVYNGQNDSIDHVNPVNGTTLQSIPYPRGGARLCHGPHVLSHGYMYECVQKDIDQFMCYYFKDRVFKPITDCFFLMSLLSKPCYWLGLGSKHYFLWDHTVGKIAVDVPVRFETFCPKKGFENVQGLYLDTIIDNVSFTLTVSFLIRRTCSDFLHMELPFSSIDIGFFELGASLSSSSDLASFRSSFTSLLDSSSSSSSILSQSSFSFSSSSSSSSSILSQSSFSSSSSSSSSSLASSSLLGPFLSQEEIDEKLPNIRSFIKYEMKLKNGIHASGDFYKTDDDDFGLVCCHPDFNATRVEWISFACHSPRYNSYPFSQFYDPLNKKAVIRCAKSVNVQGWFIEQSSFNIDTGLALLLHQGRQYAIAKYNGVEEGTIHPFRTATSKIYENKKKGLFPRLSSYLSGEMKCRVFTQTVEGWIMIAGSIKNHTTFIDVWK